MVCHQAQMGEYRGAVGSKRHSLHAVELSQWYGKPCANCVYPSRPRNGGPTTAMGASRPCGPRWMAGNAPHKSGKGRD